MMQNILKEIEETKGKYLARTGQQLDVEGIADQMEYSDESDDEDETVSKTVDF